MCTCQHNSHASINVDPSQSLHEPLSLIPSSHAFYPRALSYLIPLQLNSPIGYHSPTCATYLINPSHPLVPQPQSVSQSCNKITIRDEQMYTAAGLANHPPLFFQTSDILHAASSGPQHASSPAPVYTYNCVFPHSISFTYLFLPFSPPKPHLLFSLASHSRHHFFFAVSPFCPSTTHNRLALYLISAPLFGQSIYTICIAPHTLPFMQLSDQSEPPSLT